MRQESPTGFGAYWSWKDILKETLLICVSNNKPRYKYTTALDFG